MDMGKNRQQHEELKQVKQPSLVNYFDVSNKEVVGKKKKPLTCTLIEYT